MRLDALLRLGMEEIRLGRLRPQVDTLALTGNLSGVAAGDQLRLEASDFRAHLARFTREC